MAVDLLNRVKVFWTSEAIQQLSVMLGEHPDRVGQVLGLGAPTILAALTRAVAGSADSARLVDRMRLEPEEMASFGGVSRLLDHLAGLGDNMAALDPLAARGRSELQSLFGDRLDGVIERIATDSGAKPSTAGAVLSLLAPTLMAMIREQLGAHGVTVEGVRDFLASQRASIVAQLPGNLAETLGVRTIDEFLSSPAPAAPSVTGQSPVAPVSGASRPAGGASKPIVHDSAAVAGQPSGTWWAVPLALAVLAVAAGYYLLPQANPPEAGPEVAVPADMNPPAAPPAQAEKNAPTIDGVARSDVPTSAVTADGRPVVETGGRQISMALPGDAAIEVPRGSYLEAAIKMLRDESIKKAQTFAADDLAFNQDSTLTAESARSVEQLAIIAKAYPKARFKIEVRESPGGPDDVDQRRATAQKRAESVRDALIDGGVTADRVDAAVLPADALGATTATKITADVKVEVAPE